MAFCCLKNLPIKRKLTVMVMLTSGLALLLACAAFVTYEQMAFRRMMVRDLSITAQMIGDNSAAALSFNEAGSAEQTLLSLNAQTHLIGAAIYDRDGKLFARYQRTNTPTVFTAPGTAGTGHQFAEGHLELSHPIRLSDETIGTVYLRSDLDEVRARKQRYLLIVAGVMLGALAAAFLLSRLMQRSISEPITHLSEVAVRVASEKNYSVRANQRGTDELGCLIDSFNGMLDEIQKRDAELQKSRDELEQRVTERTQSLREEVAERKRSEEALRESEARTRTIVDTALDAVVAMDAQGVIVDWNPQAEAIFGWSRAEAIGRRFPDTVIPPEDRAAHERGFSRPAGANGEPLLNKRVEITALHRDGRRLDIELAVTSLKTGSQIAFSAFIRDIGERRRMEALMTGERQALELMASGATLPAILEVVARNIEAQSDAMHCSILLLDEAGKHLLHGAAPSLPDTFNRAIHGVAIGPEVGSCGTAACRNETVIVEDIATDPLWRAYKELALAHELRACWSKPICAADGRVLGTFAVYHRQPHQPAPAELELVERAASQARIAIERKRAEAELEKTHKQLLDASRQAGMAEVATGVLHNVGNVLNSVNVSSTLVADRVRKSRLPNLSKAVTLLREHDADMGAFLTTDPKGRQLPGYFSQLAEHLAGEQVAALKELDHLQKNIEHIKDIVAMQQTYAKTSGMSEIVKITDLVEDSLNMNVAALARHGITVVRDFTELPPVVVEKHKVLQILVNLIRNAKYACDKSGRNDKQITLRVAGGDGVVKISVGDNGVGIPPENLVRIFSHGFTTKKDGHGFGLHSGANAAKEMGGALTVASDGAGRGATFTLELPLAQPKKLAA